MIRSRRPRVAIVGAGRWASLVHIPALLKQGRSELVIVCDVDPDRAGLVAGHYGIASVTTDLDQVLDCGVDCAVVATPHDQHRAPTLHLLEAGVDVLVEKPMSLRASDAWDMVRQSELSHTRLHVGYTFPYSPVVEQLRAAVRSGVLGTPRLITALFGSPAGRLYRSQTEVLPGEVIAPLASTFALRVNGGGQLYTQATHAASLILWILDMPPVSVFGYEDTGGHEVDVVDVVSARFGECLVSLASTGTVNDRGLGVEEYRLFGDEGQALLDTHKGLLELSTYQGDSKTVRCRPAEANPTSAPATELVEAWIEGRSPTVGGHHGALTVSLLEAARSSMTEGRVITPGSVMAPAGSQGRER